LPARREIVPNNPRISVGGWIGAIVVVAALYVVAAGRSGISPTETVHRS
jgi:hypothetical protein